MSGFGHTAVLLLEVVERLAPQTSGRYLDATIGGGGHAEALLEASSPGGRLLGCDRDEEAVKAARERLEGYGERCEVRRMHYADLDEWLEPKSVDGAVMDLGVSSHQFDTAERGFSLRQAGPLDMRMDRSGGVTAAELIGELEEKELARLFFEYGGEVRSRRLAKAVVSARREKRFESTLQLAGLAERVLPRRGALHPATRMFQALRIAVNDELEGLDRGLRTVWSLLKDGGRLAVITFHSAEARRVKIFARQRAAAWEPVADGSVTGARRPKPVELRWVAPRVVFPKRDEVRTNARARSAQLRVMEKLSSGDHLRTTGVKTKLW